MYLLATNCIFIWISSSGSPLREKDAIGTGVLFFFFYLLLNKLGKGRLDPGPVVGTRKFNSGPERHDFSGSIHNTLLVNDHLDHLILAPHNVEVAIGGRFLFRRLVLRDIAKTPRDRVRNGYWLGLREAP